MPVGDFRQLPHDRAEGDLREQEFRNTIGYEHQVGEALQSRQASGYKVRWRIAWGQVLGLLILAAVVVGFLLLLFAGSGH